MSDETQAQEPEEERQEFTEEEKDLFRNRTGVMLWIDSNGVPRMEGSKGGEAEGVPLENQFQRAPSWQDVMMMAAFAMQMAIASTTVEMFEARMQHAAQQVRDRKITQSLGKNLRMPSS